MAADTLQIFNSFLTERLTAAAVDIYVFVEKTVVQYQEEVVHYQEEVLRTRLENERLQRLLDLVFKPEIRLHRADDKPSACPPFTEEIPPKLEEFSLGLSGDEPGPSQVKEEQLWADQMEHSGDDEDALTQELIKTVQQLEDCRAAEESREPTQTATDQPKQAEETASATFYRCHICNYIFTKKAELTRHVKMHQSQSKDGKSNLSCHICGKEIPCRSNLQNHMRVHTGERPYGCQVCGKSFKLKGHMTDHLRTHTGEKPFSCHVCGRSFNRGSSLRKHVFARHKEDRPYKCEACGELFTEKLLMKTHMVKVHRLPASKSPA